MAEEATSRRNDPLKVYVGNIPSDFTEEDVLNLFSDFDGIKLSNLCKKGIKTFGFIKCKNKDDVIHVVRTMSDKIVEGRRLVVKASDIDLQSRIESLTHHSAKSSSAVSSDTASVSSSLEDTTSRIHQRNSSPDSVLNDKGHYDKRYNSENRVESGRGTRRHHDYVDQPRQPRLSASDMHLQNHHEIDHLVSEKNEKESLAHAHCHQCHHCVSPHFSQSKRNEGHHCNHLIKENSHSANVSSHRSSAQYEVLHGHRVSEYSPRTSGEENCHSGNVSSHRSSAQYEVLHGHRVSEYSPHTSGKENSYSGNVSSHRSSAQYEVLYGHRVSEYSAHTSGKDPNEYFASNHHSRSIINKQNYQSDNCFDEDDSQFDEQVTVLSVANFPFGTTEDELYNLFIEFDPVSVYMVCNVPSDEVTEAYVIFSDPESAADAIINFDNTVYKRRVLIVTDADDISSIPELFYYAHKNVN